MGETWGSKYACAQAALVQTRHLSFAIVNNKMHMSNAKDTVQTILKPPFWRETPWYIAKRQPKNRIIVKSLISYRIKEI